MKSKAGLTTLSTTQRIPVPRASHAGLIRAETTQEKKSPTAWSPCLMNSKTGWITAPQAHSTSAESSCHASTQGMSRTAKMICPRSDRKSQMPWRIGCMKSQAAWKAFMMPSQTSTMRSQAAEKASLIHSQPTLKASTSQSQTFLPISVFLTSHTRTPTRAPMPMMSQPSGVTAMTAAKAAWIPVAMPVAMVQTVMAVAMPRIPEAMGPSHPLLSLTHWKASSRPSMRPTIASPAVSRAGARLEKKSDSLRLIPRAVVMLSFTLFQVADRPSSTDLPASRVRSAHLPVGSSIALRRSSTSTPPFLMCSVISSEVIPNCSMSMSKIGTPAFESWFISLSVTLPIFWAVARALETLSRELASPPTPTIMVPTLSRIFSRDSPSTPR